MLRGKLNYFIVSKADLKEGIIHMGYIVAIRDMSYRSVKYGNASEQLCEAFCLERTDI